MCEKLRGVSLPLWVEHIGNDAFSGCDNLIYNEVGNCCYLGNDSEKFIALVKVKEADALEVEISQTTKVICNNAFEYCKKITKVDLPKGLKSIEYDAFSYCESLQEITIPENVIYIGIGAFRYCESLQEVTICGSVKEIDAAAFTDCNNVKKVNCLDINKWAQIDFYNADSNPISISKNLYVNGKLIENAVLDGVEKVGNYAFCSCENLKSIVIPEGVKSIGEKAFYECDNLTAVTIPSAVKTHA